VVEVGLGELLARRDVGELAEDVERQRDPRAVKDRCVTPDRAADLTGETVTKPDREIMEILESTT
jgi:hypothetical protein